jgi:site-specific recombinase XerD
MESKNLKLTQAAVERAAIPASGQSFVRDSVLKGFALRVIPGGAKSFVWEGWVHGRTRRITLGQWPEVPVAAARKRAEKIRTEVGKGLDPVVERRKSVAIRDAAIQAERGAATFAELEHEYFERHAPLKAARSVEVDRWLLAPTRSTGRPSYIPEVWRKRKIKEITAEDVDRLHKKIGRDHGHYAANHLVRLLRTMFNLAKSKEWKLLAADSDNPAGGIELFAEQSRKRFLKPDELRRVNDAMLAESPTWQAFFPLAAFLGLRRTELLTLRWSCVDLVAEAIEIPDTKNRDPLILPLPSPAVAILAKLAAERKDRCEWVFPSRTSKSGHVVAPSKAWQRIRALAGVPDVRIHDLRHTLASWMVVQGKQNLPMIGKALNHRRIETTQKYAHLDLEPVRQALEQTTLLMVAAQTAPAPTEQ